MRPSRGALALLCVGLALSTTFVPTATAQAPAATVTAAIGNFHGELHGGRLRIGDLFNFNVKATVTLPTLGVCPIGTMLVEFTIIKRPAYAEASLSPASVTLAIPASSGVQPTQLGPATTQVALRYLGNAPAFQAGEFTIRIRATPSASTLGGCNIGPSQPFDVVQNIVVDYEPRLAASSPEWNGRTPQPIHVENHGNGDSYVRFEYGTGDGYAASATRVYLESKAIGGSKANHAADVLLPRREVPQDWDGTIRATIYSAQQAADLRQDELVLAV